MNNRNFKDLLLWIILIFLALILPGYFALETKSYSNIRDVCYIFCFISSLLIISEDIGGKKENVGIVWYLVLLLTMFIFGHLAIANIIYKLTESQSDLIGYSYCIFALILGTQLRQISRHKHFSFLIGSIWVAQCYLVLSNVDYQYAQAIYGKEDPLFSGAYQYIGDVFAFVSILFIFQIFQALNSSLQFKQIKNQEYLENHKSQKYLNLKQKHIQQIHLNTSILVLLILFVNVILFLNGSRASFIGFLLTTIFIGRKLFFNINYQTSWILLFVPSFFIVIAGFISIYNPQFISEKNWNIDALLSNRNFEFFSSGNSTSLEDRNSLYELGIQDILSNPIFGNYIQRVSIRGSGTYLHNILSLLQDFGFPAFGIFLWLAGHCTIFFLQDWGKDRNYEKHVFDSLFVFSAIQLILFRNFTSFYIVYILFGMIVYRNKHSTTNVITREIDN